MSPDKKVILIIIPFTLLMVSYCLAEECSLNVALQNIFLSKSFNRSDSQWIFDTARESYFLLKNVQKVKDIKYKINFVKNYGNFLLQMLKNIKSNRMTIYDIFTTQQTFLEEFKPEENAQNINATLLQEAINELEFAAESYLNPYYNTSETFYSAYDVLSMNATDYSKFVKETLRTDPADIGYFFLEIFATLIGFSWGIISTVVHTLATGNETTTEVFEVFTY